MTDAQYLFWGWLIPFIILLVLFFWSQGGEK